MGGSYTLKTVSQYSTSGWMEDLPQLNEGRWNHGCGYFYNDDKQRVFLVAGGSDSWPYVSEQISSTETLVEGGQAWNFQKPLPSGRRGLRGISLPESVIMTGGNSNDGSNQYLADVLMFDQPTSDWKKVGTLINAREYHGASLVNVA